MPSSQFQPLVSVIIPTYNGRRFLGAAIDSALAQTYRPIEIIVVDDGGADAMGDVVEPYTLRQSPDATVRYVRRENGGTSAARNMGLREARGELIALLDHDDLWMPQKLEKQVPLFENASVGMVHTGGRVKNIDSGVITSEYLPAEELDLPDLLAWCVVSCATTMFPKRVVDELGGFDEALGGVDDWDLWIRIATKHRVLGVREILVEIGAHDSNQGDRFEEMYRRAVRVIDKHAHLHPNSVRCRKARRYARRGLRADFYGKMSRVARQSAREGRWADAVRLRLAGLKMYPEAPVVLAQKLIRRLRGSARPRGASRAPSAQA